MRWWTGWLIITLFWPALASAEPDCQQAQNQQQMTDCIQQALKEEEYMLQQAIDQLMVKAQAEDASQDWPEPYKKAPLLQKAHKAWQVLRDLDCQLENFDSLNGSAYGDYLNRCKWRHTRQRCARMQEYLQNP